MPLPLPNLDSRRWNDLVEEARALIPRYAPGWTDHNVHDPGLTLAELLAWLAEQEIYRLNRVPERHRRKFLALLGYEPEPAQAARTAVSFALKAETNPETEVSSVFLPAGTLLETEGSRGEPLPFRTLADVTVVPAERAVVQADDGNPVDNWTRFRDERWPLPALGPEALALTRTYTVEADDTLQDIAQRNHARVESIIALNNLDPDTPLDMPLEAGRQLVLPLRTHTVEAGETLQDIAQRHETTVEAIVALNVTDHDLPLQSDQQLMLVSYTHTVEANETLEDIAQSYKTTVDEIAALNKINPKGELEPGQQLKLPSPTHTVGADETLTTIAGHYKYTVEAVAALNNLHPDLPLKTGQELLLLSGTHQAETGETLPEIARRYGTTVESIVTLNRVQPDARQPLKPDQSWRLPARTALYLGFDRPLPKDEPVSLWLWFQGPGTDLEARRRLVQLAAETAGTAETELRHHSARTVWEFYAKIAGGEEGEGIWLPLDPEAGEVQDSTRALTLDGPVLVRLPAEMQEHAMGPGAEARYYLRCRLEAGQYDAAPLLRQAALNAVAVEQATPVWQTFAIASEAEIQGTAPPPGEMTRLRLTFTAERVIQSLSFEPNVEELPQVRLLEYQAPPAGKEGRLALELVLVGASDGRPRQQFNLPQAPVQRSSLHLWTIETEKTQNDETQNGDEKQGEDEPPTPQWRLWQPRTTLDASLPTARHFILEPTTGTITFGDGDRGRIPPEGAPILASYRCTQGEAGNIRAGADWHLVDNLYNRALPDDFDHVQALLSHYGLTNFDPAVGGADEERLTQAAGRAAEGLWVHERLVDLCPAGSCATLDQLDRSAVLARPAPERAVTLLDFERLALDVPGTRVRRARAWAGIHPRHAEQTAPGYITLIIVPELPPGRPQPSPGLLRAVQTYLDQRRVMGVHLVVVGPRYLEVKVEATVRAKANANPKRLEETILTALDHFLHPLHGGSHGRGWPFGRDVYRSEVLQVIDEVPGVDHVRDLALIAADQQDQAGNVQLAPTWLAAPVQHQITVV